MPTIAHNWTVKSLEEAKLGELLIMKLGPNVATCIKLDMAKQTPHVFLGVLAQQGLENPAFVRWDDRNRPCLSLGTDWVLEPVIGDESYPNNFEVNLARGVLYLSGERAVVRMGAMRATSEFDDVDFDLLGSGRANLDIARAVPFRKWRIWLSESDKDIGDPIVEFGVDN